MSNENSVKQMNSGRRSFLARAGAMGVAAVGAGVLGSRASQVSAAQSGTFRNPNGKREHITDADILNFALNLEYLEAEYYLRAVTGSGLAPSDVTGAVADNEGNEAGRETEKGESTAAGTVTGGTKVNFQVPEIAQYASEIAQDEQNHVKFLRSAIPAKLLVARPNIDFTSAFTAAAQAAGVIAAGATFDPFSSDDNFLLGAFIFEDVGVTAYHGAAPFIQKSAYLSAAAGILGTEAYHAGLVRTVLFARGQSNPALITAAAKISALRAAASGAADDQGITNSDNTSNIVPTDANGLVFARTFQQVLNIVYLGNAASGGFFPNGIEREHHLIAS